MPVAGLPTAARTLFRVLRVWLIGLVAFGFGPAVTYGWMTWLQNEEQWRWTWIMYVTEVLILGLGAVVILPSIWYRPIHRVLAAWERRGLATRQECAFVYERA
ncbi:MAG TPA: hypothetical protein VGB20_01700, partial [bacterium]